MTLEKLQKFIDEQDELFRTVKTVGYSERERVLARAGKLSEVVGELSHEVLATLGDQRTGKMDGRDPDALGDEFADVVIVAFLLAKSMNVDMSIALAHKIEKIKARHNKQL